MAIRTKSLSLLALASVLVLVWVTPASAGSVGPMAAYGSIEGTLTDSVTRVPAANVMVTGFLSVPGPSWVQTGSAITDANGHYAIPNRAAGTYILQFMDMMDSRYAEWWWHGQPYLSVADGLVVNWGATTSADCTMPLGATGVVHLISEATGGPIPNADGSFEDPAYSTGHGQTTSPSGYAWAYRLRPAVWYAVGSDGPGNRFARRYWLAPDGSRGITVAPSTLTTATIPMRHRRGVYKDVVRMSGASRFDTALEMAKEMYPGWVGISDVVIASGEDRSAVDALSASGLAGVYKAPLLLVRGNSVPDAIIAAIGKMPPGLRIHIVGGPPAVSNGVVTTLDVIASVASVDRVSGGDRFVTAAAVARAMATQLGSAMPTTALIANGADAAHFSDALALGPVAYQRHYPILLVRQGSVPATTSAVLGDLGLTDRYIAGGSPAVSEGVRTTLAVLLPNRLAGVTRYATAIAVTEKAVAAWGFRRSDVGLAATIPDALAAGPMMGAKSGGILLTSHDTAALQNEPYGWLLTNKASIDYGFVCGGASVTRESARLGAMTMLNQ